MRFDAGRGYGFIAPESGGEDVFVHARELVIAERAISSGTLVSFKVIDGERGLKAYDVNILDTTPPPAISAAAVRAQPAPADDLDDELDPLSEEEFVEQVTEVLLSAAPSITAGEVVQIRRALATLARQYGWLE